MCMSIHRVYQVAYLRSWKIHFFAHLSVAKLISADSMLALLQSFTAVLDEFGVSNSRAKRAALCAGEGLLIVSPFLLPQKLPILSKYHQQGGPVLKAHSSTYTTEIINAIQLYNDTTTSQKWLVAPICALSSDSPSQENTIEVSINERLQIFTSC